jgi:propionate CoA-transferase
MAKNKICAAEAVAAAVSDGATIAVPGTASIMVVDNLLAALERRYLETGHPAGVTAYVPCNAGFGPGTGVDRLAHPGLLRRYIASAFPVYNNSRLANMIMNSEVEAYNFPMGVLYGLLRDIGAGRPGMLTSVGLGTYVDPRAQGGRMNSRTTEDLVEFLPVGGQERLFYRAHPIHVTLLKATTADEAGNLSFESEPLSLGALPLALAAKGSGGKVYVQVERVVPRGSIHPRAVVVPGHLIDGVVLAPDAPQSAEARHDPTITGEVCAALPRRPLEADSLRAIIARAAADLRSGWLVNLGVGLPANLPVLLRETGLEGEVVITTEHGGINGLPKPLPAFGAHVNPEAILDPPSVFDMYDGGVLDATLLGMAQADAAGDVNVSMFGGRLMGCGGFIDITARTRNIFFCSTLTAGGSKTAICDGRLVIEQEGKVRKLVGEVEHRTFNGRNAVQRGQKVRIVTDRGLFLLTERGWMLTEVAPGVDPRRDIAPFMGFELSISERLGVYEPETMMAAGAVFTNWLRGRIRGAAPVESARA